VKGKFLEKKWLTVHEEVTCKQTVHCADAVELGYKERKENEIDVSERIKSVMYN
jgi:hypothetical protein